MVIWIWFMSPRGSCVRNIVSSRGMSVGRGTLRCGVQCRRKHLVNRPPSGRNCRQRSCQGLGLHLPTDSETRISSIQRVHRDESATSPGCSLMGKAAGWAHKLSTAQHGASAAGSADIYFVERGGMK